HHASRREIETGGFAFGVYEEGPSTIYSGGTAEPRLTMLGANPLRQAAGVALEARSTRTSYSNGIVAQYELGEPVFVELRVSATAVALIPNSLDPIEGFTRVTIERPNGSRVPYRPPLRVCARAPQLQLRAGQPGKVSHSIPLFLAADGPVFSDVGTYRIWVELAGVNGNQVVFAQPIVLRITAPVREVERLAQTLFSLPGAQEALFLRHPLVSHSAWSELEEAVRSMPEALREQHTLLSYMDYVAGLGWAQPFSPPGERGMGANPSKAVRRMRAVNAANLPPSAAKRVQTMLQPVAERKRDKRTAQRTKLPGVEPTLPPSGLFGQLGLNQPKAPARPISPFEIVVRSLEDSPAFADIVSWNIQHLHGDQRQGRIEKIAEYMLAFRCDFWSLQEVGEDGVRDLVDTMNRMGDLSYAYEIVRKDPSVPATGQQNACVYRTDTTTVAVLPNSKLFDGSMQVELKDGSVKTKRVFDRRPLLCDVRVRQSSRRAFDFRCAVVHLKSTDPKLKDSGNAIRAAAAEAVARWVAKEREDGLETDFLVMGDMNAETAQQGLAPFAEEAGLTLLSLGMRAKYGKDDEGAVTRFASGRLLDHIVISSDTVALMPESDENEQIIVRSDVEMEDFNHRLSEGPFAQYEYSDHLPVAVRIVLGKDRD
ncbi:MAG TPA: endonuclease/exonuclease/phosphatase family protein, partial [Ideonella sp.]|nr:endonuclease/exonuclease/phosphatase family protein [Ideonella sp.]